MAAPARDGGSVRIHRVRRVVGEQRGERIRARRAPRSLVPLDPGGHCRAIDHDRLSYAGPATTGRHGRRGVRPGRPRMRSPRMLRMISDVPPSIELAARPQEHLAGGPERRVESGFVGALERVVVPDEAVGAEQVDAQVVRVLVDRRELQLGDRALGPGIAGLAASRRRAWLVMRSTSASIQSAARRSRSTGILVGALAPEVAPLPAIAARALAARSSSRRRSSCARS